MQRWEALEDMFTEALHKQCLKGTTLIVRVVRICQITKCLAMLTLNILGQNLPVILKQEEIQKSTTMLRLVPLFAADLGFFLDRTNSNLIISFLRWDLS